MDSLCGVYVTNLVIDVINIFYQLNAGFFMKNFFTLLLFVLFSVSVFPQLNGTKTVGSGGDYATLAAAIAALNPVGVDAPLVLSLTDAAYSETGASLVFNITANVPTATNTVTIKPAAGITPTITITGCVTTAGASQYSGIAISNNSYIIFDGSNTEGGTTKDLTINMNDGTNGRHGITLFGNTDNITVKNTNIIFQTIPTANSTRGIYVNGQSTGTADNLTVQNCVIGDATKTPYYAVAVTGYSTGLVYCTNVNITNSTLYGRIRPVYFFYVGTSVTTSTIANNTIATIGGVNATATYTILMNTWNGGLEIKNNVISTLTTNNTTTSGIYGISGLTAASGTTDCRIYNNKIGGNTQVTGTGVPTVIALVYLQDNGIYKVYNNSFYYNNLTQNCNRACLYISGASANVDIKNNIFYMDLNASNGYCIYKSNGTVTSDYNCFYATGALTNTGFESSAKLTLANWQATTRDYNSVNADPQYTSSSNLSINTAVASRVSNIGTPLATPYDTDIDGTTRDASNPDIGADEFGYSNYAAGDVAGGYQNLDLSANGDVALTGNVVVDGVLTLGGVLTPGAFTLTLTRGASISGASSSNYIAGAVAKTMALSTSSTAFTFPVGKAGAYRPVTFTPNLASGTGSRTYTWEVIAGAPTTRTVPGTLSYISQVRYWNVKQSNEIALGSSTVTLNYGVDDSVSDYTKLHFVKQSGAAWVDMGGTATANGDGAIDGSGGTTFGASGYDFALANDIAGTNPLPVELTTFSATNVNGKTVLNWKTATEVNSASFVIERAAKNSTDLRWNTIGEVKASGNSNSERSYSFRDVNVAPGRYAYRMRMVDNDGTYNYSKIVEQDVNLPRGFMVSQNYPNPFNPTSKIDFELPADANVQLDIFAISGEKVASVINGNYLAGFHSANVNTQSLGLGSGVYFYRVIAVIVTGEKFINTKKMVVLK